MSDLISRQDAINLVKHRMKHNPMKSVEFIQGLQDAYLRVISDLNRLSPADVVERKRGKWIHYDEGDFDYDYKCSLCDYAVWDNSDYCPNCGARMECEEE